MWVFYVLALIPLVAWAALWMTNKNIVIQEWLISFGVAILMSVIFHVCALKGMTGDIEIWSGEISHATHHPEWVEKYRQRHTRTKTVGSGENRRTVTEVYYTTEYRTHPEHWEAYTTIDTEHDISQEFFQEISRNFKNYTTEKPHKSGFHRGDPNVYTAYNKSGYCYPTTTRRSWSNKVKAAPSLFSFTKVPETVKIYEWPSCPNWQESDRLVGTASILIDKLEFDRMMARLGPLKHVNVIMVGFGQEGPDHGQFQQAKWVGGKKNDLVICFGGATKTQKPTWAFVFGWTDKEIVKQNLQTIVLNNGVSTKILPLIEAEVKKNYVIKDWSKFDYITIEPPTWSYVVFGIVMAGVQVGLFFFFHQNEWSKSRF